jgi:hypothetical protein
MEAHHHATLRTTMKNDDKDHNAPLAYLLHYLGCQHNTTEPSKDNSPNSTIKYDRSTQRDYGTAGGDHHDTPEKEI